METSKEEKEEGEVLFFNCYVCGRRWALNIRPTMTEDEIRWNKETILEKHRQLNECRVTLNNMNI